MDNSGDKQYGWSEESTPPKEENTELIYKINSWKQYEIDFDKVKTLDDVILILKGLKITVVNPEGNGLDELIPYLKEITE